MPKNLTTYEYESIERGLDLPDDDFNTLLDFISSNRTENEKDIFRLNSAHNHEITSIKTTNYVGVVQFSSGSSIEILPKVGKKNEEDVRKLFINMLDAVIRLPFREFDTASLNTNKLSIREFFISKYIEIVQAILRNGIAASYYDTEENEHFIKGRIDFTENLRLNLFHKERFYLHYQLFGPDRPENRLIKSTLKLLNSISNYDDNRRHLNALLNEMEEIPSSDNYDRDFDSIHIDREMRNYKDAMIWSRIFLGRKTFDTYSGHNISYALLFPMDKLYESYIRVKLEEKQTDSFIVSGQDTSEKLFADREIRPDIVLTFKNGSKVILDTKWKIIEEPNNISISDLYQMFVYSVKFKSIKTILLYPDIGIDNIIPEYKDKIDNLEINIQPYFINLYEESCIEELIDALTRNDCESP